MELYYKTHGSMLLQQDNAPLKGMEASTFTDSYTLALALSYTKLSCNKRVIRSKVKSIF